MDRRKRVIEAAEKALVKIIEKIEELAEKKSDNKKSEAFMGVENRVK
mgnify:CR=1 FL=1